MPRILVIDDDETVRDVLRTFLSGEGFQVTLAEGGEPGMGLIRDEKFDIVLTDLVMPQASGMEVLKEAAAHCPDTPVIMMTAYAAVETAVEAMKLGAFDYIGKPFVLDELSIVLNRVLEHRKLQKENIRLKKELKRKYDFGGLIGDSASMGRVYDMIEKIADTDSTVLIAGESGTGKELVARIIHYNSSRSQKPFVPINCAAIPRDLLESELFGHEKGAFTGALNARAGRFELAHNGTLFLDEIGELDPSLQVKLLRVLQEREFERVGGVKTIKVDVRILAATNKDLEKATREGKFREDLFYRLNVIPLNLPPLRERLDDIPLLLKHFIKKFSRKRDSRPFGISREAMECLMKYHWPGNVRELENLVERLMILVNADVASVADLPERFGGSPAMMSPVAVMTEMQTSREHQVVSIPESGVDLDALLHDLEKDYILRALRMTGGVKSKAANLLHLNRTTLIEKMKKMRIDLQEAAQSALNR
jgi:nitrogen regulation protein NR(I)